jgi:hypothetical protein
MNEDVKTVDVPALKAGLQVIGLLPQIAGLIVGLSAIAYLTGWRDQSAYFTALGVPWALSLLSPTRIMQASTDLVTLLALISFIGFLMVAEGKVSASTLKKAALCTAIIAVIAVLATVGLKRWGTSAAVYISASIASLMWAAFAGIMVSRLIASLVDEELRWDIHHLWSMYAIIFYGIWMSPSQSGAARAERDLDLDSTKLATVLTTQAPNGPRWQLVTSFDSQVLVMQQGNIQGDRRFRLVSNADVIAIFAPPK